MRMHLVRRVARARSRLGHYGGGVIRVTIIISFLVTGGALRVLGAILCTLFVLGYTLLVSGGH